MGVRYAWRARAVLGRCASTNASLNGEAMAHPPLSSCGAEVVPCLGVLAEGEPSLRHLMSGSKREPSRTGLGWGRPAASSRTRDEASAGWSCSPLTDIYAVRHKTRETGPNWANPVANHVPKDEK